MCVQALPSNYSQVISNGCNIQELAEKGSTHTDELGRGKWPPLYFTKLAQIYPKGKEHIWNALTAQLFGVHMQILIGSPVSCRLHAAYSRRIYVGLVCFSVDFSPRKIHKCTAYACGFHYPSHLKYIQVFLKNIMTRKIKCMHQPQGTFVLHAEKSLPSSLYSS
jgi:hypothetical protein